MKIKKLEELQVDDKIYLYNYSYCRPVEGKVVRKVGSNITVHLPIESKENEVFTLVLVEGNQYHEDSFRTSQILCEIHNSPLAGALRETEEDEEEIKANSENA